MYYNVMKSVKYRHLFSLNLKSKWFLNIILKNHFLFYDVYKYNWMKNNISICKMSMSCIINGSSRSTSSKFSLSSFFFKAYASKGLLTGITKF